jgi:aspartate kinase
MKPLVAKFGGTSMGSAQSLNQVVDILQKASSSVAAVVSATSGTTDRLILLGREAVARGTWEETLRLLRERHETLIRELGVACDLQAFWSEAEKIAQGVAMIGELSLSTLDRLQSLGERVSATILTALLEMKGTKAVMIDAREIVFTDDTFGEGNVDFDRTYAKTSEIIGAYIRKGVVPVITGFIGQSLSGNYITLGRGGSDYSGAIVAAALDASELQIWTDVDGILNTDPRIVSHAKVLDQLSFYEAGELAYFGAKVLHPKTIKPAIEKNIPVRILNTFNPLAPGTVITNDVQPTLKAVTSKKNVTIVNVTSLGMLNAHGFLAKIFDVFAEQKVVVDVVTTSEVSVSVTIDHALPERVLEKLRIFASVDVQEGMAIVCLVGEGIRTYDGLLGKLFSSISGIPVSLISQGASKRNITFAVPEAEADNVIRRVFDVFFL